MASTSGSFEGTSETTREIAVSRRTWSRHGSARTLGAIQTATTRRFVQALGKVLLAEAALGLTAFTIYRALAYKDKYLADFQVLRGAGSDVVHGRAGGFIYPPPSAFAMIPFSYLQYDWAAVVWLALLFLTIPLTLLVLGVRDWRCLAAALLASSTLAVFGSGAISSFLALGAALIWRYRNRTRIAVPLAAATIVSKIFLWPLIVWLVATRRLKTAAEVAGLATAAALAGWAATGFAGFGAYPAKLQSTAGLEQNNGYSIIALAKAAGAPALGRPLMIFTGLCLLSLCVIVGRRSSSRSDQNAFLIALAASLVLTPISWLHYFVLTLIPLGLSRPRFSWPWLIPLAYWGAAMRSDGNLRMIIVVTVTSVGIFALAAGRGSDTVHSEPSPA